MNNVTKDYTYIGGDAYTAPVVAVNTYGTIVYYYLLRDYLGNITHVVKASDNTYSEYSFDAWGRRRNPVNWGYDLTGQPELFGDRGFTSHEHLKWFNVVNMNGRLYDPLLGRLLSPDINVSFPDLTKSFNRYSYALNNPLKFTDPDGNNPILALIIWGAFFGGAQANSNGQNVWKGSLVGGASAAAGGFAGGAVFAQFGGITSFASGFASGASGGFAAGFIGGAGNSWMNGGGFGDALRSGMVAGGFGALTGGAFGGVSTGIGNVIQGNNFWTGQPTDAKVASIMAARPPSTVLMSDVQPSQLNSSYRPSLGRYVVDSEICVDENSLGWYDNYSDGSQSLSDSWPIKSGPGGLGRLPEGRYSADHFRLRTDPRMVRDGVGFSVDLNPQFKTTRNLLRIHPDGQKFGQWWLNNGTDGCIGLQTHGTALRYFANKISSYFNRVNSFINLSVNY